MPVSVLVDRTVRMGDEEAGCIRNGAEVAVQFLLGRITSITVQVEYQGHRAGAVVDRGHVQAIVPLMPSCMNDPVTVCAVESVPVIPRRIVTTAQAERVVNMGMKGFRCRQCRSSFP